MAASTQSPGVIVQSWIPPELAEQLKAQSKAERRSVSAVVRIAIEDQLSRDRGEVPVSDFEIPLPARFKV